MTNRGMIYFSPAWKVCMIAAGFALLQFVLQTHLSVMVPQLMAAFSIDPLGVSLLSSSYFYTYLLLQIPAGILVDFWGARRVLNLAIVSCACSCLLFACADNLYWAEIARLGMGLSTSPAIAAAMYLCCRWFPPTMFALMAGIVESMGMLGGALGEITLSIVTEAYGWREAMLLCAIVGLLLAVLAFCQIKDTPYCWKIAPKQYWSGRKLLTMIRVVLKHKHVWLSGLYSGFMFAVASGFAAFWCVPFLQEVYQVKVISAATLSSTIFLGCALGAPLLGWFSDKIDSRRMVMFVSALLAFLLCCWIIYFPPKNIVFMPVILFICGIFSGAYMIPFAVVRDTVPMYAQGTAMGFTNLMSILIGAPIFQPLVGWLLQSISGTYERGKLIFSLEDYQLALSIMPFCLLMALLSVGLMKRVN